MKIDVIIPALNEAANIPALLKAMPWPKLRRVIIVDNGSTDLTAQLAAEGGATVARETNRGYGAACLKGLHVSESDPAGPPDIVAFIDADLADDPSLLPSIFHPIERGEADLVIGSRVALAQPGALTTTQRFGNRLACGLIRLCTGARFTDLGPMRAIRWRSLQSLHMRDRTWGWTVEMQFKAGRKKLRCLSVNVPYRPRHAGESKISGTVMGSIKAGWKILTTIVLLQFRGRDV